MSAIDKFYDDSAETRDTCRHVYRLWSPTLLLSVILTSAIAVTSSVIFRKQSQSEEKLKEDVCDNEIPSVLLENKIEEVEENIGDIIEADAAQSQEEIENDNIPYASPLNCIETELHVEKMLNADSPIEMKEIQDDSEEVSDSEIIITEDEIRNSSQETQ